MTTHLLITGATGLLGRALVPLLEAQGHFVITHGFHASADVQADLCSYSETFAMLTTVQPNCIVNLAALTNVDTCERDPHSAYMVNVATVRNLCDWIKQETNRCHLIQLSTDQIYDSLGSPHREADIVIRNTYAFSKISAEIVASNIASTILRTNFFGRSCCPGRYSFSDWIYQMLQQGLPIQVFEDVLFTPLAIPTLCEMIDLVVKQQPVGVFNLGSRDGMSKADFAYAFAEQLGLPVQTMSRVRLSDTASLKAYRPKDMRMDSSRFEQQFGFQLPKLIDEITSIRSQYLEST